MEKEVVIRPSLLSADFTHLGQEVEECLSHGVTHIHFDVMDGSFVEQISYGEPIFKQINNKFGDRVTFDVHLMVVNPVKQVRLFAALGAKEISVHIEALTVSDFIALKQVRDDYPSIKLGLAFSPETSVDEIKSVVAAFDFILVMSVVPGKGGQKFIPESLDKIAKLDALRKENHYLYKIGVDGGINVETGPLCLKAGVDWMVAGHSYFSAKDRSLILKEMRGL